MSEYLKNSTKKHNLRTIRKFKRNRGSRPLQMLTCYDFQTARALNETSLDIVLVGDSLANVMLGHETTISVGLEEMKIFGAAVKRGAQNKFTVIDLPFGTYNDRDSALKNATELFRHTQSEALKLEGAFPFQLEIIERLTQIGIPVMGHIGLTPQSVHQMGGYYTHGKTEPSATALMSAARALENAGAFSVVLECVEPKLASEISNSLDVPTIGIGSGAEVDGQVLVINDLLGMGESAPSFCKPIANFRSQKLELIQEYINKACE